MYFIVSRSPSKSYCAPVYPRCMFGSVGVFGTWWALGFLYHLIFFLYVLYSFMYFTFFHRRGKREHTSELTWTRDAHSHFNCYDVTSVISWIIKLARFYDAPCAPCVFSLPGRVPCSGRIWFSRSYRG